MSEKVRSIGKYLRGRPWILVTGLVGLALLICGGLIGGGRSGQSTDSSAAGISETEQYRVSLEERITALCRSVRGVGSIRVSVMLEGGEGYAYSGSRLTASYVPEVRGVAVVCAGGDSDTVRAELTDLICALCHIGANRVHISPMGDA